MSEPLKSIRKSGLALALVAAAGVALALYTALLKLAALPCFTAGCGRVINSEYGSLLGLPVGIYGAACWFLLFVCGALGRTLVRAVLVIGSLFFIGVQAFALGSFCVFCTAHAVAGLSLLFFNGEPRKHVWAPFLAVVLAFAVVAQSKNAAREAIRDQIRAQPVQSTPADAKAKVEQAKLPEGVFPWLSETGDGSLMVVSLTCEHCQQWLESQLAENPSAKAQPALILKVEPGNRQFSEQFTAAVLSGVDGGMSPPEAFRMAYMAFLDMPEIAYADDPGLVDFAFDPDFPDRGAYMEEAREKLDRQQDFLGHMEIVGTPTPVEDGVQAWRDFAAGDSP